MTLQQITSNRWKIYFFCDGEDCPIGEYIAQNFNDKAKAYIYACLEKLADHGYRGLPTDLFHDAAEGHEVRDNNKIYKMYGLTKMGKRLYAILEEHDQFIIFTHATEKRSQKTSKEDIAKFHQYVRIIIEEKNNV